MTKFEVHWRHKTTLTREELKEDIESVDSLHFLDLDTIRFANTDSGYNVRCITTSTLWGPKTIEDEIVLMYGSIISCLSVTDIPESSPPKDSMDVCVVMEKIRAIFPKAALETDDTGQAIIYTNCIMIQSFVEMD